jgi:hypothetical protein
MLYDSIIRYKLDSRDSLDILGLSQRAKMVRIYILEILVCYRAAAGSVLPSATPGPPHGPCEHRCGGSCRRFWPSEHPGAPAARAPLQGLCKRCRDGGCPSGAGDGSIAGGLCERRWGRGHRRGRRVRRLWKQREESWCIRVLFLIIYSRLVMG